MLNVNNSEIDMNLLERQAEIMKIVTSEIDIANSIIFNDNFISMAEGGLVKVITKGNKLVEQIIIDEDLLDNPAKLSLELKQCLNRNITNIDIALHSKTQEIYNKYGLSE